MEQNKVRTYLLYAIGEIALVMIGILLALQVNNWNEERKMRDREHFFLKELQVDFDRNYMEAEEKVVFSENQVFNISLLLDSMNNPDESVDNNLWFTALNHSWFLPHPVFVDNTWMQLQSTGNLSLLQNDKLVREIGDFYREVESVYKLEAEWSAFYISYRKKVNEVMEIELRNSIMKNMLNSGVNILENSPDARPYILKLKNIEGVMGSLSDIEINRGASINTYKNLQERSRLIIESIDNELKRFKD